MTTLTDAERKQLAAAMMPSDGDSVTLAQIASTTHAAEVIIAARVAEALAPIEALVAVTRCEDIHSATEDPPCASCTSFARFAVARRDVRLPAPEPTR